MDRKADKIGERKCVTGRGVRAEGRSSISMDV